MDLYFLSSFLKSDPRHLHLISLILDVLTQKPPWASPWAVQLPCWTVFQLPQNGLNSLTTNTEDQSTGRSEQDPGGSVAKLVTPLLPASSGHTDMPPENVISWSLAVHHLVTRLSRVERINVLLIHNCSLCRIYRKLLSYSISFIFLVKVQFWRIRRFKRKVSPTHIVQFSIFYNL